MKNIRNKATSDNSGHTATLRYAQFGKAELRMSAKRCPKFGSAAVKRDVKNERK